MAKYIVISPDGASKAGGESKVRIYPDGIYMIKFRSHGEEHEALGSFRESAGGMLFEADVTLSHWETEEELPMNWFEEGIEGMFHAPDDVMSITGPLTQERVQAKRDAVMMPPPPRRQVRVRRRVKTSRGKVGSELPPPQFVIAAGEKGSGGSAASGGRDVSTDELEKMTRGLQKLTLKRRRTGGRHRRRRKKKRRTRRRGRRRRTRRRRKRRR